MVLRKNVKVSAVPMIEGLAVKEILGFYQAEMRIANHLPRPREWLRYDRKWICDLCQSLEEEEFLALIRTA